MVSKDQRRKKVPTWWSPQPVLEDLSAGMGLMISSTQIQLTLQPLNPKIHWATYTAPPNLACTELPLESTTFTHTSTFSVLWYTSLIHKIFSFLVH